MTNSTSPLSFAANLREAQIEAQARYALVLEHADELGGSPALAPQGWSVHRHGLWLDELQRRYWNIAEYEGWTPLPGYIPGAARMLEGGAE